VAGCNEGRANGTQTEYEEGVEIDQWKLNGGFSGFPSHPSPVLVASSILACGLPAICNLTIF
jgi:hypothetical protein